MRSLKIWTGVLIILIVLLGAIGYAGLKVQQSYERNLIKEIERLEEFEKEMKRQQELKFPRR